jgi:putative membrane protein
MPMREPGSEQSETFKVMERRLLRVIMNPAMTIAWAVGLWLAWSGGFSWMAGFTPSWPVFWRLSAVHGCFAKAVRLYSPRIETRKSPRYWRMMNEVPTLLMIAIVVLVIVKPFA